MGAALSIVPDAPNLPRVRDFRPQELDLIRRTVAADTNPTEFDLFMEVCRRVGLDPFRKQIYAVVYSKDNAAKRKMSIITGIDGYRSIAARSGAYRPDEKPPVIVYREDLKHADLNPLGIESATVTVYRYGPDGQWHPASATAYWDEFAPLKEEWAEGPNGRRQPTGKFTLDKTSMWFRGGRTMIAKCAEAQALRKGWPEDLSGVYVAEEMAQAQAIDLSASAAADSFQAERAQKALGTAGSIFIAWRAGEPIDTIPTGQMVDRCDAFFRESDSATELLAWRDRNQRALQDFWARHKPDALEVKRLLETRIAALSEASD